MQTKKSNWLQVFDALPAHLRAIQRKPPLEIRLLKNQQALAVQPGADAGLVDFIATVGSSRAKLAQLGGGQVGYGGDLHLDAHFGFVEGQQLDAHRIDGVGGLAVRKVADGALMASAMGGDLCLRDALGHEAANEGFEVDGAVGDDCFSRCVFGVKSAARSQQANILKLKPSEPFVQIARSCAFGTQVDQGGFGCDNSARAGREIGLKQLHTKAGNTLLVLGDACLGVNSTPYLDVAVAEQAAVEVFSHSDLLFGRFWEIDLPAFYRLEIVDEGLDGLYAWVFSLGVVGDFSRQTFSNTGCLGDKFPSGGAGLFELALEVFND